MATYEFYAAVNDGVINVPIEYRNRIPKMVKVVFLPEEPAKENGSMPKLTREELDAMLEDSVIKSLIGAIPNSGRTLEDYRAERLSHFTRKLKAK
jgi:hypothetical protein